MTMADLISRMTIALYLSGVDLADEEAIEITLKAAKFSHNEIDVGWETARDDARWMRQHNTVLPEMNEVA